MHKNDKFLLDNNLQPRGILKWAPFNSLGHVESIAHENSKLEYEKKIQIDEQQKELINQILETINNSTKYHLKYFANNKINTIYSKLILNPNQSIVVVEDNITITINDIIDLEE